MESTNVSFFSRRLAAVVASIILFLSGCATDLEERRFGFVSMGMTPAQVARLLGVPSRTSMEFEPSGYYVRMKNGKLEGVAKRPEGMTGRWYGISPAELAALGLHLDASTTEVEAALGVPAKEGAWYATNDVIGFAVNFEGGRAVSKSIFHVPPI